MSIATITVAPKIGFKALAHDLEEWLDDSIDWLVLNSPNNPGGFIYSEDELKDFAKLLDKFPRLKILSDDTYAEIMFDDRECAPHICNGSM